MEVIRGGATPVVPPEPEGDNPMTVGEALNVVNGVLTTQYRAFDKLKAVLTAAQQVEDNKASLQADLDGLKVQIGQSQKELIALQGDIKKAKVSKDRMLDSIAAAQEAANHAAIDAREKFQQELAQQQADFDAKLKEQALTAQTNLEENIAGLKREQGGLTTQISSLQTKFDSLDAAVVDKTKELNEVQAKLDAANAALADIKARL